MKPEDRSGGNQRGRTVDGQPARPLPGTDFQDVSEFVADCDVALVEACLGGDERAFRALVKRFQAMVFGLCYRMLGHREDAEDAAQDVFLRVFRSLHRWDPTRPLKPWLLTIAANRCRTALKARARRPIPTEFVAQTEDKPRNSHPDLAEELQRGLDRFRQEYRTCFILFYQQELSIAEIAEIMDAPSGTIKTWLHRVRRDLAELLRRRGFGPEAPYELHRIPTDPGSVD